MELIDKGFGLIEDDLKRLRKYKSLKEDLGKYFKIHDDQWKQGGQVSGTKASGKNYIIGKKRIGIKNPRLGAAKGGRLWFYINTKTGEYHRLLLYIAQEEKHYLKATCFKIVGQKIKHLVN